MPATVPAGVVSTKQRAGLEGDVGSVWGRVLLLLVFVVEDTSEGAKAMVSRSLASVASTLSSARS